MLISNSQAVHVGNFLPRRRATASCTRVDEICTDRPEERNPNCDPTCRPILPGRRVSLIHLWDNSQDQTKLLPPPATTRSTSSRSTALFSHQSDSLVDQNLLLAVLLQGWMGILVDMGPRFCFFGFPFGCIELIDQSFMSLDCDLLLSGGFSGRNGYC